MKRKKNDVNNDSFFENWLVHKRNIKTIKTQKASTTSWLKVTSILLICMFAVFVIGIITLGVILNSAVNSAGNIIDTFASAFDNIATKNPEIAALAIISDNREMNEGEKTLLVGLTLLKQMQANGDVQGEFYMDFSTKNESYLEKDDLQCIDKYKVIVDKRFDTELSNKVSSIEYVENQECEAIYKNTYNITDNMTPMFNIFYKCPMNNCKRTQKTKQVIDDVMPRYLRVNRMAVSGGGLK